MRVHASCVAQNGAGVLLLGPSGSGKSDMALRLLDRGFVLVADDQVDIVDGWVSPPPALRGLLEVRGLGILRLPCLDRARLALAVDFSHAAERLPAPTRHERLDVPLVHIRPEAPSAAQRIALALDCARGRVAQIDGAFSHE